MPQKWIYPNTIEEAVEQIIPYLEDTSNNAHKVIYFDGWSGLAASAVLREIGKEPPPSLVKKFDKIIHVDCSRWKSRRALQRTIAQELRLSHQVMDVFDRQDEEDDFRGVDEGSRAEIEEVGEVIYGSMRANTFLLIFHNGSDNTIGLNDFGIPQPLDRWSVFLSKVLWTFRGRLRLNSGISEKVDTSHLYIYDTHSDYGWKLLLQYEAREIVGHKDKISETAVECCSYLLSLDYQAGNIMDYNWATHASSYWVCDGIIEGGQDEEAWDLATALHQQVHMEDYSCNAQPVFDHKLETPSNRWISARSNSIVHGQTNIYTVHPESTSFFFAGVTNGSDTPLQLLPNDMFYQSDNLHVLKLCHCTFSFSCAPFHCCHNLRFLGLASCKDHQAEEDDQCIQAVEFCKSLWVLDISYTDWELDLSPEILLKMAANIREVHIKSGRFWNKNFAWRKLQNLHKLRVVEPTCPWETGEKDEFIDMVKMELLDLSGNNTIQVLPSLSRATSLQNLVLDGCLGLEFVEELPPLLESFSFDAGQRVDQNKEAKISRISLAGCARLVKFRLCGSLPNLEELDLSGTLVKILVLKDEVVQVPSVQKIILLGCLQLHAILWPEEGLPKLSVLHIGSLVSCVQTDLHEAYATIMDIRFLQTLVLANISKFCWNSNTRFHLNLCAEITTRVEEQSDKKDKTCPDSSWQICMPRHKSLIPNTYNTYKVDNIAIDHDRNESALHFQQSNCHVEIGEGISNITMESIQGINVIMFVMSMAESLHVHDNSSITTVIAENMTSVAVEGLTWTDLKQCHVVRCPKMHTVFNTKYDDVCFEKIETFWAADLPMAHCIWSKGRTIPEEDTWSFTKLRSIHLYSCPRLTFVLPLWWIARESYFPNLETLHIVSCGDLVKIFPVEPEFLERIVHDSRKFVFALPKLKHIYLHELYKLQHICEGKMFAPELETVRLRGCWGLRRLPAVGRDNQQRPVVDCEKAWWEKLEWDGLEAVDAFFDPVCWSYHRLFPVLRRSGGGKVDRRCDDLLLLPDGTVQDCGCVFPEE